MKVYPYAGNRGVINGTALINRNLSHGIEVVRFTKEIQILKMEGETNGSRTAEN